MQAPSINTFIIDTWDAFNELVMYEQSAKEDIIVVDVETDSVHEKKAKLFGVGIAFEDNKSFYFPIRDNKGIELFSKDAQRHIADWLEEVCSERKLVGHNIIYDVLVLENNWNITLTPYIYSDTILMKHTLNEERPFGLKECAVQYLGAWADKAQKDMIESVAANGGSTTKDDFQMWRCDTDVLATYCAWDCALTYKLFHLFEPKIQKDFRSLFYLDEIMPLYREVTIPMKRRGFPVDVAYFNNLEDEINEDIEKLEKKIQESIKEHTEEYCQELLHKDYPVGRTGSFPKMLAEQYDIALPIKNGKITLARAAVAAHPKDMFRDGWYWNWLLEDKEVYSKSLASAQMYWFTKDTHSKYVFNLNSTHHLSWLFFEKLGCDVLSKTEGGKPQCDDNFLDSVKEQFDFVPMLVEYKKLIKLSSTYIAGILEREHEGVIYTSFLQFGTTSGRYSSTDPNLQNLPRIKDEDSDLSPLVLKYVNAIKRGFVAPAGMKIVNADYSQLEPRAFAIASGDKLLQQSFIDKEDLYGAIAKNVFNLDCKPNEVKKKYPEYRQTAKIIALAVVYGAEAGRISQIMKIEYAEADSIIKNYLDSYPDLRTYMERQDKLAVTQGYVASSFGRVRHLPAAKRLWQVYGPQLLDRRWAKKNGFGEQRYQLKNACNNAKNMPIQSVAAHIVNRSAIAVERQLKEAGIKGGIVANVHDELTMIVASDDAPRAAAILQHCMENTVKLAIPLVAAPIIGKNWAEAK